MPPLLHSRAPADDHLRNVRPAPSPDESESRSSAVAANRVILRIRRLRNLCLQTGRPLLDHHQHENDDEHQQNINQWSDVHLRARGKRTPPAVENAIWNFSSPARACLSHWTPVPRPEFHGNTLGNWSDSGKREKSITPATTTGAAQGAVRTAAENWVEN